MLNHTKTHVVFPGDCNSMGTIFGGKILELIDLCCFEHSLLLIEKTDCDDSVTVNFKEVSFLKGPVIGDLIKVNSSIDKIGIKSLTYNFTCSVKNEIVTKGSCVFVTRKNGVPYKHGLSFS